LIRILLCDDHAVIRRGLRLLLEQQEDFEVVGEASDGREAVNLTEALKPDIALLDITMPNLNGIEAARQITAKQLGTSIIVLSMHADESFVLKALKAGARGYVLKEAPESELIKAVRLVSDGKSFFSPVVSRMLVEDYVRRLQDKDIEDSYELLTAREREILQLVAEAKSNKDIAAILNLSLYTVETHRSNIMEKLNLHSVPELILYAVRKGIIR
jgi:two-component system, NarL family, response regulator NreC